MYRALFLQHGLDLAAVHVPVLGRGDALGPFFQKTRHHIAAETEFVPHVVGNIEKVLHHVAEVEVAHRVLLGDGLKQKLHIVVGGGQKVIEQAAFAGRGAFLAAVAFAPVDAGNGAVDAVVIPLVLIHDLIGPADQRVQIKGRLVGPGITHCHVVRVLLDALAQRLHVFLKALPGEITEQSDEFITAGTVDPWSLQSFLQKTHTVTDQPVSCVMPQGVVGLLKAGDVAVNHAQLLQIAQQRALLEHGIHGVAVIKIGKRIVIAQGVQPA